MFFQTYCIIRPDETRFDKVGTAWVEFRNWWGMPLVDGDLTESGGLGVGQTIRNQRQKKGVTLRELADRLGCSQAKLSNIETGKVGLDLAELMVIGGALHVSAGEFFPPSRMRYYSVQRGQDLARESPIARKLVGPAPGPPALHNLLWPLAQRFVGKHMEPVLAQIQPLRKPDFYFISHDHEEFMFVLKGDVETSIRTNDDVVVERLTAGDCIHFRSYLPHCHRSVTAEPAETLHVTYSLRGAIDPDDSEISPLSHLYYRRGADSNPVREAAEKIGLLRRAQGLTLPNLANELGVSRRHLGQVERGERPAEVDLLVKLARRFRRPIEFFLATTLDQQPNYFVQRGKDIHTIPERRRKAVTPAKNDQVPHVFRPLAGGFPDRGIHPYYLQVRRYAPDHPPSLRAHYGQEFIYVLDGEVEFLTHVENGLEQRELLRAGDALFLESSVPHLLRGHSRNPYASSTAEVIDVFWCPLGESYLFESAP